MRVVFGIMLHGPRVGRRACVGRVLLGPSGFIVSGNQRNAVRVELR